MEGDAGIDRDIDVNDESTANSNDKNNNVNATAEARDHAAGRQPEPPSGVPGTIPADMDALAAAALPRKETSLREFLGKMDDYAPIVSVKPGERPLLCINV